MKNKLLFKQTLQAAALYNVFWGAWVVLFPFALFDFAGLVRPNYPEIWQCVGMIVGVYGVGCWLVICVRHSGCTFCREELSSFSSFEQRFHSSGIRTAVIHMGAEESGVKMKEKYNLQSTLFLSDPDQHFYRLFELKRGTWSELLGPKNWMRGFIAGVIKGHGVGPLEGDGLQLGGTVYLENGNFEVLHRSTYAGDIGDFSKMTAVTCC